MSHCPEQLLPRGVNLGKGLGDVDAKTLTFFKQIGVEQVTIPSRETGRIGRVPLVPPTQRAPRGAQREPFDAQELCRIKAHVESFGLSVCGTGLQPSGEIVMGGPERNRDIDLYFDSIRAAGQAGLGIITYNFTALRASEGYRARHGQGRGRSSLRDFDFERVRGLPPLQDVGRHNAEEMWARLKYFLEAVVPVAEEAGVRLAVHPNDPPVHEYRGVAQPLIDVASLTRLLDIVDSPSNSLFFDTGVMTEAGENPPEAIRTFGGRDRIAIVHYRNVRVDTPRLKYTETFIDEGECDMRACMQAFCDVGYAGTLDPDHSPGISGDSWDNRIGWGLAFGYITGLRSAVQRRAELRAGSSETTAA